MSGIACRVFFTTMLLWCCIASYATNSTQYAVMVDAGSSGSRVHVFQYAWPSQEALPLIQDVFTASTEPGLSFYSNNPTAASASLKPILDAATSALQTRGVDASTVPIRILATAGMRLLPPSEQTAIYRQIETDIKHNYAFSLAPHGIETITGQMEGLYGWLDLNYLLHRFERASSDTSGYIDMGGASTQIAFALNETTPVMNKDDVISMKINNKPYRVFSASFLGLGQNEAQKTMNAHPDASACYPEGYELGAGLNGLFNAEACSDIYTSVIANHALEARIPSTEAVPFVASSGIYYAYRFFDLINTPTQSMLDTRITEQCYWPWRFLQQKNPNEPEKYLARHCANAMYFKQLLYGTYQLQPEQLSVALSWHDTTFDWTLGALLYDLTYPVTIAG